MSAQPNRKPNTPPRGNRQPSRQPAVRHLPPWLFALGLFLTVLLSVAFASTAQAASTRAYGAPEQGKRIYDYAHLLTPAEVADLERRAAAVAQAGAPTVVYLQVRDATHDQTVQDARDLMDQWNVQSASGAHDGIVIFLNLQPGNLRHGDIALYAGQTLAKGKLPQYELERIYSDVMLPPLESEQTAQGIAAGLDAIAHDLTYGPPPPPAPSPLQSAAAGFARIPYNVLAFLAFVGFLFLRAVIARRGPLRPPPGPLTTIPPGHLAPALAGALVRGRIADDQIEATILDFAHRDLLVLEPIDQRQAQVRLRGDGASLTGYERNVWQSLTAEAGSEGIIPASQLAQVRSHWAAAKDTLRRDLLHRGWYDLHAGDRRRPFYLYGTVSLALSVLGVVLIALSQEGWGALGAGIFFALGFAGIVNGLGQRDTTAEGEQQAAAWRGYRAGLRAAQHDPALDVNLDDALPFAVALDAVSALSTRLQTASAQGYSPAWFRPDPATGQRFTGFFPYWIIFHSSFTPTSSGTSGGTFSGGASSGGVSAGGHF